MIWAMSGLFTSNGILAAGALESQLHEFENGLEKGNQLPALACNSWGN